MSLSGIRLQWSSPAYGVLPLSYRIVYTTLSSGVSTWLDGVAHCGGLSALQSYTLTSVAGGTAYRIVVHSSIRAFVSQASNQVEAMVLATPSGLTVPWVDARSVRLTWNLPPAAGNLQSAVEYLLNFSTPNSAPAISDPIAITAEETTVGIALPPPHPTTG